MSAKQILENLLDALVVAEPVLGDLVRTPLRQCREKLVEIERLAEELES